MSEFKFDGPNLRWMGFLVCNALRDANYQSMANKFVLPIGDQFHLLCSGSSIVYDHPDLGSLWGKKMIGGFFSGGQPVAEAWFVAGRKAYENSLPGAITNNVTFRVAGWDTCFGDTLKFYTDPDPTVDLIDYVDQQVYP